MEPFEKEMLKTIQKYYPIYWDDVRTLWEMIKSYDAIIKIIEHANNIGENYIDYAYKYLATIRVIINK